MKHIYDSQSTCIGRNVDSQFLLDLGLHLAHQAEAVDFERENVFGMLR
jgi:hypothetical protein